ncbi:hypothetical protein [Tistrella bauzanensis]|nr:hypothetical protein [Tistrella bauzanensis]
MTISLIKKFMSVTLNEWKIRSRMMKLLCGLDPIYYTIKMIEIDCFDNNYTKTRMKFILDIDEHLARVVDNGTFRREWLYHNTYADDTSFMSGLTARDQGEFERAATAVLRLHDDQLAAGAYWCVEPRINHRVRALKDRLRDGSSRLRPNRRLRALLEEQRSDDQDGTDN